MIPQSAREPTVIVEIDQERDRKQCIALNLKIDGDTRELAQWLVDHPRYSSRMVAEWLGGTHTRIVYLRKWAANGFVGLPNDKTNKPDNRDGRNGRRAVAPRDQSPLETNDNPEIDMNDGVAAPEVVEDSVLYIIARIDANARATKRVLKASAIDREAAERINTAIERMIKKWRSIQSTLARKGLAT